MTEEISEKMETYYQKENQLNEEYSRTLISEIPLWAKTLIELYSSPLKYEIQYQLKDS